jgi:hypothetical protein
MHSGIVVVSLSMEYEPPNRRARLTVGRCSSDAIPVKGRLE